MPSFDIVSEIDKQEIDNALNQARKELATRFDFKGSTAEVTYEKDKITLTAEDGNRLRGLREIVIGKLSKRGVDLRNMTGRRVHFLDRTCAPGAENSAGARRNEGKGNYSGDQRCRLQGAERVAGPADSRDGKEEGRFAGGDCIRDAARILASRLISKTFAIEIRQD